MSSLGTTLEAHWALELASDQPVARLAAEELQATLVALGGPRLAIVAQAPGPRLRLSHGPAGDGFLRAPDPQGFNLHGDGPRGLLFAVYDLLESLGCCWPTPTQAYLPQRASLPLPNEAVATRPALAVRSLVLGHDLFLAEAKAWIVWAARNRLNTIFMHTTIHDPALGACRLQSWRQHRRTLLPLIKARGLRLELGGHHLRDLLPRRLFRSHPDYFRHNGTRRTPDHNLCVSNPEALALLQRSAAAFYRAYPEAEVYHLWPDDLRAGGWCHCPACAHLSPADQTLLTANALARALPPDRPTSRVSYLAYHDTAAPPTQVQPHAAVTLLAAPRTRSYAVDVADPLNRSIVNELATTRAAFAHPAPTDPPHAVFEYYLDGILFKSAIPPLGPVIANDLAHYQRLGLHGAHVLLTGDRPFLSAPPNAYLFAQLAWDPAADPAHLLQTYAIAQSPLRANDLVAAYAELARAWQPILARDPAAEPELPRLSRDPVTAPPHDILDPLIEPQRAMERRLEAMSRVEAQRATRQALINQLANDPLLAKLWAELVLADQLLAFFAARQRLYILAQRQADAAVLMKAHAEAQALLDALLAWADQYVPANALAGHRLLRAALQLQIDHQADQHWLKPWARLGLRARRAGDLARLLPGLIRLA
ncbi:MAG: DUF4838 domain-containing protein [Oscillochloridaceae bacterium umkhey_bin13]